MRLLQLLATAQTLPLTLREQIIGTTRVVAFSHAFNRILEPAPALAAVCTASSLIVLSYSVSWSRTVPGTMWNVLLHAAEQTAAFIIADIGRRHAVNERLAAL